MHAPSRIMIISTEYPPYVTGGLGTHVEQLATGLAQAGIEVFVFVFVRGVNALIQREGVTVRFFSASRVNLVEPKSQFPQELNDALPNLAVSFFEARGQVPDIIHFHEWFCLEGALRLQHHFGSPTVGTVHFLHHPFDGFWGEPAQESFIELESRMCRLSDAVITVSHSM